MGSLIWRLGTLNHVNLAKVTEIKSITFHKTQLASDSAIVLKNLSLLQIGFYEFSRGIFSE